MNISYHFGHRRHLHLNCLAFRTIRSFINASFAVGRGCSDGIEILNNFWLRLRRGVIRLEGFPRTPGLWACAIHLEAKPLLPSLFLLKTSGVFVLPSIGIRKLKLTHGCQVELVVVAVISLYLRRSRVIPLSLCKNSDIQVELKEN